MKYLIAANKETSKNLDIAVLSINILTRLKF